MKEEYSRLVVQVQPNAKRNQVQDFEEGVLRVKIAAPPVKGRANRELTRYLSEILGVAGSRINIEKGATSKRKLIGINGLDKDRVASLINRWLKEQDA